MPKSLGAALAAAVVSLAAAQAQAETRVPPLRPLSEEIMGPVRQAAARVFPGVPIVPTMTTGATDGRFLNLAGIPTYGLSGMFGDPDGGGVQGLNERIRVRSLYDGRDFLYAVIRAYASQA